MISTLEQTILPGISFAKGRIIFIGFARKHRISQVTDIRFAMKHKGQFTRSNFGSIIPESFCLYKRK